MLASESASADEEVIELKMPRPRSISRKPEPRPAAAPEQASKNIQRRQSDAEKSMQDSRSADDQALEDIAADLHKTGSFQDPQIQADSSALPSLLQDAGHPADEARSSSFAAALSAVSTDEISEMAEAARNGTVPTPESLPRTSSPPVLPSKQTIPRPESITRLQQPSIESPSHLATIDLAPGFSSLQPNPTQDFQYATHHGSRGISPPPGFDDSAVPLYSASSGSVPSYQMSDQGLPLAVHDSDSSRRSLEGMIRDSTMTEQFMNAHIARHGNESLSPMALLTPDQADTLPEYVMGGTSFSDQSSLRGRSRQAQTTFMHPEAQESMKALEAMEAVRALEESEALEAIRAMETHGFNSAQLMAINTMGDCPEDYFPPGDQIVQGLSDDPHSSINESDMLSMLAQYARPQESASVQDDAPSDTTDELQSILRDRELTANAVADRSRHVPMGTDGLLAIRQPFVGDSNMPMGTVRSMGQAVSRSLASTSGPVGIVSGSLNNEAHSNISASASTNGQPSDEVLSLEDRKDASKQGRMPMDEGMDEPQNTTRHMGTGYAGGHGVKKVEVDPETQRSQVAINIKRAQAYSILAQRVNERRSAKDLSQESFDLTTKLLMANPEYYSIWNYRREIMQHGLFMALNVSEKQELLSTELKRLQAILQDYPKVYWIWTHRKWCLAQCPWPDWSRELLLVTKLLEQDSRNFHVWEYRRYVVAQSELAEESSKAEREFEYTTAAIKSNFSNFSAWHNRTKLIPKILLKIDEPLAREEKRKMMLNDELDLIRGAIYTDPDDQSVWLYHQWLLNPQSADSSLHPLAPVAVAEHVSRLKSELDMVDELLVEEPENVLCSYAKVHYSLALQRLQPDTFGVEARATVSDMLSQLEHNDALRSGRYEEWFKGSSAAAQETIKPVIPEHKAADASKSCNEAVSADYQVYTDLKTKASWSSVTLSESGITAVRANVKYRIVLSLSSTSTLLQDDNDDEKLLLARVHQGKVSYYSLTMFNA